MPPARNRKYTSPYLVLGLVPRTESGSPLGLKARHGITLTVSRHVFHSATAAAATRIDTATATANSTATRTWLVLYLVYVPGICTWYVPGMYLVLVCGF